MEKQKVKKVNQPKKCCPACGNKIEFTQTADGDHWMEQLCAFCEEELMTKVASIWAAEGPEIIRAALKDV